MRPKRNENRDNTDEAVAVCSAVIRYTWMCGFCDFVHSWTEKRDPITDGDIILCACPLCHGLTELQMEQGVLVATGKIKKL